jgi:NAD(P)H-dependent FMN reductase
MNVNKQTLKEDVQSTKDVHPKPPTEPSTLPDAPKSIAIITCSTRPSRIGHFIAQHVTSSLSSTLSASTNLNLNLRISSIDLASDPLPLLNEPAIPAHFPASNPTSHYAHAHSRAWSAEIRQHVAFVFVTPQYHEWGWKPAFVVSYGNRGGGLAAAQLVQVCKGLRMKAMERTVGYKTKVEEAEGVKENGGFSEERMEVWRTEGVDEELKKGFDELLGLLIDGMR